MSALDDLGVAAHQKLRAQEALAQANQAMAAALAGLYRDGTPKCRVGSVARADLAMHGFSPEDVARLGMSDGNVRVMLDR